MAHMDFVQRVEAQEQAAAEDPVAFRRQVAALSLLAVLWVWGGLLMGLALLAWAVLSFVGNGFQGLQIFGFFGAMALLLSVLRLTRSDWVVPDGIHVPLAQCPRLLEALERIRQKIGGPPIHQLVITEAYDARIVQQVRLGGLLPARNHLLLGLPLAMAIDRPRLIAVIAQEYAHLRRNRNWLGAWIFRARRRLQALYNRLADARQMTRLGWINERFMRWYMPRWWAASFVVARQDELVADRLAARLVTKPLMGDALSEVAVRGRWCCEQFWTMHWLRAQELPSPMGPYSLMAGVMNHSMDVNWVYQAWKQEYQAAAGYRSTRPGLRERLDNLGIPPGLTPMSSSNSLAWLGPQTDRWIELLDQRWCERHTSDWLAYHQILQTVRARAQALMPREPYLEADGLVELGWNMQLSEYLGDPLPFYKRALELEPDNHRALVACASRPLGLDLEDRLQYIEQAFDAIPSMRPYWSHLAHGVLDVLEADEEDGGTTRPLRADWDRRAEMAKVQLLAVREERQERGVLHQAKAYTELEKQLWPSELEVLQLHLAHCPRLRRAWLVARPLLSVRGSYALVLVLDRPDTPYQDCKKLEDQWRDYLRRELLAVQMMPGWIVHLDELGAQAYRQLEALPEALVYDRTVSAASGT